MLRYWILDGLLRVSLSLWEVLQYSTTRSIKILLKAQPTEVKLLPCVFQLSTC